MSGNATHPSVVAGVDGSPASTAAITWAARDAVTRRVPLTLVHVLPEPAATTWPQPPVSDTGRQEGSEEHRDEVIDAAVEAARRATADHPVEVEQRVLTGDALKVLVEMSCNAAVVAVGPRGQSGGKRRTLGSIAAGLIRHAHCPVAIIHDEIPSTVDPMQSPVLLGIDGPFEVGDVAIGFAFDEASRRGVGVVALHCCGGQGPSRVPSRDERLAGETVLAERLVGWERAYPHVALERRLVHGDAASQMLEASEQAQLTVVGGHGRGGVAGMLLGSVSAAVVQAARTPVVIARMRAV